jgi:hypothetical protein
MKFYVNRHRFFGPGDEAPDVGFIPPMQRRKMSRLARLAVGIAEEVACGGMPPVVFASRFGEWRQSAEQMFRYCSEKDMSPAGFGLSVHNAAPSLLSILKGNRTAYIAISGAELTFDAWMLESAATLCHEDEVLAICAAEGVSEAYCGAFGDGGDGCGDDVCGDGCSGGHGDGGGNGGNGRNDGGGDDGHGYGDGMQEFAIGLLLGRERTDESAVPLCIDFRARNRAAAHGDLRRAQDFMRFMRFIDPAGASSPAPPPLEGPCCTLRRCGANRIGWDEPPNRIGRGEPPAGIGRDEPPAGIGRDGSPAKFEGPCYTLRRCDGQREDRRGD